MIDWSTLEICIRFMPLKEEKQGLTWATWIFSFPNSLAKLWERALTPNLPAAKALVSTFPLMLAVAPVKRSVPLLPLGSSISFSLNAWIAPRAKEKAPATLVCREVWISSGVSSRKGFHTKPAVLKSATRITYSGFGNLAWIPAQAAVTSSCEYDAMGNGVAFRWIKHFRHGRE